MTSKAPILQYFTFEHLPEHLKPFSQKCSDLADFVSDELEPSPELSAGLRKLLEAKDCFVRAALVKTDVGVRD